MGGYQQDYLLDILKEALTCKGRSKTAAGV
jgi:hypothetical protein